MQTEITLPISESTDTAFLTAVLLTASLSAAEKAVLRAMDAIEINRQASRALTEQTVAAALPLSAERPTDNKQEMQAALAILHPALHPVLEMSKRLRHCWVLRFALRMSRVACARLLNLREDEVDEATGAAACELARLVARQQSLSAQFS
jgi:hypothetical protein